MTVRNEVITVGVCDACGADVRAESLYCYNCGGKVEGGDPKSAEPIVPGTNGSSTSRVDDSIVDSTSVPRSNKPRRRPEPKKVQVTWERSDGPGYLFVVFAIAVAVVVLGMLALAAYLN